MPGPPQAVEGNGNAQGKAKPPVKHQCMMAITAVAVWSETVGLPESCATDSQSEHSSLAWTM